jgi:hypothetical protein
MPGRLDIKDSENAPGPGAYAVHSQLGKAKNAVSMKGRYEIKDSQNSPGPGAYTVGSSGGRAPSFSMGLRGPTTVFASSTNPMFMKDIPNPTAGITVAI